jgi:hypothetical protein
MFTTAGPTADAALAIEFLPRHPGQHLESSELPAEPWLLKSAGETDADTKEFSIGNPTRRFQHSKIFSIENCIIYQEDDDWFKYRGENLHHFS